jgi:hypothetical protein
MRWKDDKGLSFLKTENRLALVELMDDDGCGFGPEWMVSVFSRDQSSEVGPLKVCTREGGKRLAEFYLAPDITGHQQAELEKQHPPSLNP